MTGLAGAILIGAVFCIVVLGAWIMAEILCDLIGRRP